MNNDQETVFRFLTERPAAYGEMLGYRLLTELHNGWIRQMLLGRGDMTLQAHRGSYKTTAVGVALSIQLMLRGSENCMFIRKTGDDVKEVIRQVQKNLEHSVSRKLFYTLTGRVLTVDATATTITTSAYRGVSGAAQLIGIGTQSSITGKHADRIFTDDIVNLQDRKSRAERERVKAFYHELHNVCNRAGRIVNTGTPWHKEDAFTCMPEPEKWDCYQTGLMSKEKVEELRSTMPPSLFAANYELRHIAAENALFPEAPRFATDEMAREILKKDSKDDTRYVAADLLRDGIAHIDAAYGGEDYTAFTCGKRHGDKLFMYGKLWHTHVDIVLDAALADCKRLLCGPVLSEDNGDKGFLSREIQRKGYRARTYHEHENKYMKIAGFLRKWWPNIVWLEGTDSDYLAQIMDYTEDAEHDDAPDSAACVCRHYDRRSGKAYVSPFGG